MASYTVNNLFVISRKNYNIVKWSKPALISTQPSANTLSYTVFRTANTNGYDYVQVASITSLDSAGALDTIYVDLDINPGEIYFYKINAVDAGPDYDNTGVYSTEATGIYFADIQDQRPEKAETIAARWYVSVWANDVAVGISGVTGIYV